MKFEDIEGLTDDEFIVAENLWEAIGAALEGLVKRLAKQVEEEVRNLDSVGSVVIKAQNAAKDANTRVILLHQSVQHMETIADQFDKRLKKLEGGPVDLARLHNFRNEVSLAFDILKVDGSNTQQVKNILYSAISKYDNKKGG